MPPGRSKRGRLSVVEWLKVNPGAWQSEEWTKESGCVPLEKMLWGIGSY
jgi:hypothetical protein